MWDLAWFGKGMTIDLTRAPDFILPHLWRWTNEQNERENEQFDAARAGGRA